MARTIQDERQLVMSLPPARRGPRWGSPYGRSPSDRLLGRWTGGYTNEGWHIVDRPTMEVGGVRFVAPAPAPTPALTMETIRQAREVLARSDFDRAYRDLALYGRAVMWTDALDTPIPATPTGGITNG